MEVDELWDWEYSLQKSVNERGAQNACYGQVGYHDEMHLRPKFAHAEIKGNCCKSLTISGYESRARRRFQVLFSVRRKDLRVDKVGACAIVQDTGRRYHGCLRATKRNGHFIFSVLDEKNRVRNVLNVHLGRGFGPV